MRIALVGGGLEPIPPPGWGAAENLIWNFARTLEQAGQQVDIYNSLWFNEPIDAINRLPYDFVHLHFDFFAVAFNRHLRGPYCLTSHYGGFGTFVPGASDPRYDMVYADTLDAPGNIVFSEQIANIYRASGYRGFLRVLPNPVEREQFTLAPHGNGRAIYLGRIQPRKRQAVVARLLRGRLPLDFVGPYDRREEPAFLEAAGSAYLGPWQRSEIYARLSEYSCLVLLSRSEGDPLVVKEALAAGLCVVITRASCANLSDEPFITVLPDAETDAQTIANAVQAAIDANATLRPQILDYSRRFDYGAIVPRYLRIIEEFREATSGR